MKPRRVADAAVDAAVPKIVQKSGGCLALALYVLGFVLLTALLAGQIVIALIGVVLIILGDMALKKRHICGACGNPVIISSSLCPTCSVTLGPERRSLLSTFVTAGLAFGLFCLMGLAFLAYRGSKVESPQTAQATPAIERPNIVRITPPEPSRPLPAPSVPVAAPQPAPAPPTAEPRSPAAAPTGETVTLESLDGRTIKARVLSVVGDTVLILRDDGKPYDLKLSQLSEASRGLVKPGRTATAAQKPSLSAIPNTMPVDVYLNCEQAGFAVQKDLSSPHLVWTCLKKEAGLIYMVTAHSSSTSTVRTITAMVGPVSRAQLQPGHEAHAFLGWASSSAFTADASQQQAARAWVERAASSGGGTLVRDGLHFDVWLDQEQSAHLRISVEPKP